MHQTPNAQRSAARRVLLLGATGTIGRATAAALLRQGHEVVCFVRPRAGIGGRLALNDSAKLLRGCVLRSGDVTDPVSLRRDGFCDEPFDAVVSCLASRNGSPKDAWSIDYQAHADALEVAQQAGVQQMVLLSAICVQKPILAFQQAKLAFERKLAASGMTYSIVRPTAFFKSLSGQVDRLKRGKPFLMFGDGALTACKPISADDLGDYLASCLTDTRLHNRVLPIGGPGKAITPREQGEALFSLLGQKPRFRRVPISLLDGIIRTFQMLGYLRPALKEKAELARIGRYYATESMLVLDQATGCYDESATPSFGQETLFDFYARLIRGETSIERGDHAVF